MPASGKSAHARPPAARRPVRSDPEAHFPPQRDGDLVRDGVCSLLIADKLGVSQPTCGEHMRVLSRAGLVRSKKIKQWVFYQRDEERITAAKELLSSDW